MDTFSFFVYRSLFSGESESDSSTPAVTPTPDSSTPAVTPTPSRSPSVVATAASRSTHAPRPTDYEFMSSLHDVYYGMAIFCGIVLLIFTLVTAVNVGLAAAWLILCYTVGAVLSMFAVGRVIELLQQIRDAVRSNPALSPSRSDDE
jgi:hypothetical protein